jgi:hypothetical protein
MKIENNINLIRLNEELLTSSKESLNQIDRSLPKLSQKEKNNSYILLLQLVRNEHSSNILKIYKSLYNLKAESFKMKEELHNLMKDKETLYRRIKILEQNISQLQPFNIIASPQAGPLMKNSMPTAAYSISILAGIFIWILIGALHAIWKRN